jgi:hypothetical protein
MSEWAWTEPADDVALEETVRSGVAKRVVTPESPAGER